MKTEAGDFVGTANYFGRQLFSHGIFLKIDITLKAHSFYEHIREAFDKKGFY